ncbi:cytochrome c oxidase subunit 6B1-like [Halichondria panicea]|uniref:cytochrome c oxidase subunit 6B1-like n=1 Tax=Halichondria panicea TaxID=6063 RepID=UPI00312B5CDB
MAQEIKVETAPFDARFPNVNQTRHCWQHYVDFHKCEKVKGEGADVCQYFQKVYRSMCPVAWTSDWDEQREAGSFPGKV